MNKDILKYSKEIAQITAYMQLICADDWKEHFAKLAKQDFSDLDLDELSLQEEQELHVLYKQSVLIVALNCFPAHIMTGCAHIVAQLSPLFEDTTAYLSKEPNNTVLLNSIAQYEHGEVKEITFL